MAEFSKNEIFTQLERILVGPEIKGDTKIGQFLSYVTGQTFNGSEEALNQYKIGVEALNYPVDFNPQNNPMVRIHAGRLRRALTSYYSLQGADDPIVIEIPKGSYAPVFTRNRGSIRQTESAHGTADSKSLVPEMQAEASEAPSLAVLPLDYLGNEPEFSFFANGITEEIIIALTRFQEFFVVGPLDRDIINQRHMDPIAIGQEYGVRFVLDGTIRLRGESLRLTVKLTDARNGRKVWGQTHDHDLEQTSIDQIDQEIVGQIVTTLADNFGVIPRTIAKEVLSHQWCSLSDYSAILRFHHHVRVLNETSLIEATQALEQVVKRDPDNDLALALLGDLISTPYWLGYTDDQYDLGRAVELGKRALALNPNSQPGHFTMAIVYYLRLQKRQCLNEIDQALDLNPNNANYLANSALFLMGFKRHEDGLGLIDKAMRWNPHHPGWYHFIPFQYHYYRGDYKTALVHANGFNTPDYLWDPLIRTAVLGQLGHLQEAEKAADEVLALVPSFAARGRSLIYRMLFHEENVEMLADGLAKAGLKVV